MSTGLDTKEGKRGHRLRFTVRRSNVAHEFLSKLTLKEQVEWILMAIEFTWTVSQSAEVGQKYLNFTANKETPVSKASRVKQVETTTDSSESKPNKIDPAIGNKLVSANWGA